MITHSFELVGGDTDGLAFKKPDQSNFSKEERIVLLNELNSLMDGLIHWEDDGVFPFQLVVKAKNYVLVDESGKRKIKGSALKATTKEKALQQFLKEVIEVLIKNNDRKNEDVISELYFKYAKEILNLKDISQWCSKKTITKAVLTNERTQERRVREALKGRPVQEGDKIYTFFKTETELSLMQDFNGIYDVKTLLGKLYDTLCIFETVLNIKEIPNLTLKKNKPILNNLSGVINANL